MIRIGENQSFIRIVSIDFNMSGIICIKYDKLEIYKHLTSIYPSLCLFTRDENLNYILKHLNIEWAQSLKEKIYLLDLDRNKGGVRSFSIRDPFCTESVALYFQECEVK